MSSIFYPKENRYITEIYLFWTGDTRCMITSANFTKLKRNEWSNLPYNSAKDSGQKQYFTYLLKYDVQCVQTDKRRMHDKIPVILFSHTMPI